jgi:dephospho-CoA kinase
MALGYKLSYIYKQNHFVINILAVKQIMNEIARGLMKSSEINLIVVVGMPGAKKTYVCQVLEEKYHIPYLTISDVIKQELSARNRRTDLYRNYSIIGRQLKEEFGPDVFAKRMIKRILSLNKDIIVVDGVRSVEEIRYFRRWMRMVLLVAVHASIKRRFEIPHSYPWIENLYDIRNFNKRDCDDLKLGLGNVIALADFVLINEEYFSLSLDQQIDLLYFHILRVVI